MKRALIFGVSGQDGAYLSQLLGGKGYEVHGTSRDPANPFARLHRLGVRDRVITHAISPNDAIAVRELFARVEPDEIYNLCGLSSVAQSFREPDVARSSIVDAQLILLEAMRMTVPGARLYQSASSECFGDLPPGSAANEETPFAPRSPYAAAKAEAHRATIEFRNAHDVFACSGLVFNHESPLRAETFVTAKIVAAAARIARDGEGTLTLGDLTASRDWGHAPEYVEAFWSMLQQPSPQDFVIATGESHTVAEFAEAAFAAVGLDAADHVAVDESLLRGSEIHYSRGDASRAAMRLQWRARTSFSLLVRQLVSAAVAR